jgi:hypothetical protein
MEPDEIPVATPKKPFKVVQDTVLKPVAANVIEHVLPETPTVQSAPKQWKARDIYVSLTSGNEHVYKKYCETHNDLSKLTEWESQWSTFLATVKASTWDDAEPHIRAFVENLRRIRHNALCETKRNVLDREDRQVWPAETVVKLFLDGGIQTYKHITEMYAGDSPGDPKWEARWEEFVGSLESNRADTTALKRTIALFMTAQRTKKYRRSKK